LPKEHCKGRADANVLDFLCSAVEYVCDDVSLVRNRIVLEAQASAQAIQV